MLPLHDPYTQKPLHISLIYKLLKRLFLFSSKMFALKHPHEDTSSNSTCCICLNTKDVVMIGSWVQTRLENRESRMSGNRLLEVQQTTPMTGLQQPLIVPLANNEGGDDLFMSGTVIRASKVRAEVSPAH